MLIEPPGRGGSPQTPDAETGPVPIETKPAVSRPLRAIALLVCILFSGLVWMALAALF